jgi:hypothetical protein
MRHLLSLLLPFTPGELTRKQVRAGEIFINLVHFCWCGVATFSITLAHSNDLMDASPHLS